METESVNKKSLKERNLCLTSEYYKHQSIPMSNNERSIGSPHLLTVIGTKNFVAK